MFVPPGAGSESANNLICKRRGLQGRVMWLDAEANLWALSSRELVAQTMADCKAANINTIVVDVKPLSGFVLYMSRIAPRLVEYLGKPYPPDYDLLCTVIEEGHAAGMAVHAAINVFSEGSQKVPGGPAYQHPDWQCVQYDLDADGRKIMRRVGDSEAVHHAVFVNPLHPEARAYALSVVREICESYPIDGLVLDRMRYPNLYSDFSEITRAALEARIGKPVARWPEDVFERANASADDVKRGPLFGEWIKFRAGVIRDFLAEARQLVKSIKPNARMGMYVGSWYPLYYDVGVNWGSPRTRRDYDWWPQGYEETGYADLLDYICTGCYYAHPTRQDAISAGDDEWKSVEAAAEESISAVNDDTFVYGSLYLMQYHNDPGAFARAISECLERTQGLMIFDLVYVRDYDWWSILEQAFPAPAKPPHDFPDLLKGEG